MKRKPIKIRYTEQQVRELLGKAAIRDSRVPGGHWTSDGMVCEVDPKENTVVAFVITLTPGVNPNVFH